MTRILLSGCNGRMGQVITRLAQDMENVRIAAGYDVNSKIIQSYPVYNRLEDCKEQVDVIVDFSHPDAIDTLIPFAVKNKIPLVVATTGLSSQHINRLKKASEDIPVFQSANMSLGVNLLIDIVKKAAAVLYGSFDIEIIEKHHNQKIDSPSGTALAIADAINSILDKKQEYVYDRHARRAKRSKDEIGIHSVRGGTIVGEHTVIFAGNDEILEIKHSAASREIFAVGAIRAAQFIKDQKPGMYSMDDIVNR